MKKIGHKGADALVAGNTLASFDVALSHGVSSIEFDVLRSPDSKELIVAHDYREISGVKPPTLGQVLEHFKQPSFAQVDLLVDLKLKGYEIEVLEKLREFDLIDRSLISTQHRSSIALIREAEPGQRLGWTVPRASRDYTSSPFLAPVALAALQLLQRTMPKRAARAVNEGSCEVITAYRLLVTKRLVDLVHDAGGEVYVWTVDEAAEIKKFIDYGVDGIITNDPRLFR